MMAQIESIFIISHHADELQIPVDSEIVVEKIVVNPDDSHYSYFGPPDLR